MISLMQFKLRKINLWVLFLGFSAFVVFGYISETGLVASIGKISELNRAPVVSEKVFSQSRPVRWTGVIMATMSGGSCIGVKGSYSGYGAFMACLPDIYGSGLSNYSGTVTVSGTWTGITCAYDTIFGSCVPDIVIERISL